MPTLRVVVLILLATAGRAAAQPPPVGADPKPVLPVPTRDLVPALIDALRDPDSDVRLNAAVALAAVGPDAVESLTAALNDRNPDARAGAAYALGLIGAPAAPATAELIKKLKDDETEVRRQTAQALGRIVAASRYPIVGTPPTLGPVPPPPVFPPIDRFRP
jgi:hypothetical protein